MHFTVGKRVIRYFDENEGPDGEGWYYSVSSWTDEWFGPYDSAEEAEQ